MSVKHLSQNVYLSEKRLGVGFLNIKWLQREPNNMLRTILVFIIIIFSIPANGTELLAIAAQSLRAVRMFPATTEPKPLHHWVYLSFKNLGQLTDVELKYNKNIRYLHTFEQYL